MTWRGSVSIPDRIFGIIVYCFAIYDTLFFGSFLLQQFPAFGFFCFPALPVELSYGLIASLLGPLGSFASFAVFIILFAAVVRNEKISHFIRYNTMQSVLISISLALARIVMQYVLIPALGHSGLLIETFYSLIFLGGLIASYYSMFQSTLGRYAQIPTISEAAYSRIR